MEKLLLTLRGATEIMAVLLVVMYQERWFLQRQLLKLCKRSKGKSGVSYRRPYGNGEDVPEWLKNGDYEFEYNIIR